MRSSSFLRRAPDDLRGCRDVVLEEMTKDDDVSNRQVSELKSAEQLRELLGGYTLTEGN
jgi:hypothetical protein